jgi:hypothetical protein
MMAFYVTIAIKINPLIALCQASQKHDVKAFYLTIAIKICPVLALCQASQKNTTSLRFT